MLEKNINQLWQNKNTLIAPSLLAADFSNLAYEIKKIESQADILHLDIMDGHFVPNITFGPSMVKAIRSKTTLPFDAHLMIANPEDYIDQFIDAGCDIINFHIETVTHIDRLVQKIKAANIKVGITLLPTTPLSSLEYILSEVDMVLIMSVNPGFGGQQFMHNQLPKIAALRQLIDKQKLTTKIQVDGGINKDTARLAIEAGADILVAGSYLFSATSDSELAERFKNLRN